MIFVREKEEKTSSLGFIQDKDHSFIHLPVELKSWHSTVSFVLSQIWVLVELFVTKTIYDITGCAVLGVWEIWMRVFFQIDLKLSSSVLDSFMAGILVWFTSFYLNIYLIKSKSKVTCTSDSSPLGVVLHSSNLGFPSFSVGTRKNVNRCTIPDLCNRIDWRQWQDTRHYTAWKFLAIRYLTFLYQPMNYVVVQCFIHGSIDMVLDYLL